jgi:hypothetical protein
MNITPEDIINALDECPMSSEVRSEVAYRILSETNHRDKLVDEMLDQYRGGFRDKDLLERLSKSIYDRRINSSQTHTEYLLHIAWGILPNEGVLDGYLAEYYYDWAGKLGIPEEKVSNILLEAQSRVHNI